MFRTKVLIHGYTCIMCFLELILFKQPKLLGILFVKLLDKGVIYNIFEVSL